MSMQFLDQVSPEKTVQLICSRFRGVRIMRGCARDALLWQASVVPRPGAYFRWHLPRWLKTMKLIQDAIVRRGGAVRILEIGVDPPFSILLRKHLASLNVEVAEDVRTSIAGGEAEYRSSSCCERVQSVPLLLGGDRLPWKDGAYDLVIMTEVIEHVCMHPQLVISEINRVTAADGLLVLSTPNVTSWKKIYAATNGDWGFDSPTFAGEMGHRYEYSNYEMHVVLRRSGYACLVRDTCDLYWDDPIGITQAVQRWLLIAGKLVSFQFRSAAKMILRGGSTSFFVCRKTGDSSLKDNSDLISI